MASKPKNPAAAKAAKQKKLAIALSVVLVLALAYAFHTMQGLHKGTPASVAATTSTTSTTTAVTTPATPSVAPAPVASSEPTVLVAAVKPDPGTGQLQSFNRFESKDPFAASGPQTAPATAATSSPQAPATTPARTSAQTGAPTQQKPAAFATPPPTSAVLAVNGAAESVVLDADFPVSTDPTQNGLFHLVALTAKTATVSVVGGSYASGAPTLKLQVNRPVTLVNTADGKRYTIELFPQGTPAPAAPAAPATITTATP